MSGNNTDIVDVSGKNLPEEDVKKRINELRKMVLEDNKLKNFRTADEYLLRFLHCTDFDIPLAFKKMQDFSDFIIENPDWFATMPPLEKKEQIEKNDKILFRERDKGGRAIMLVKLGKMDTTNSCPTEQSQIFDMWLESMMDDPKTQAAGLSGIIDMKDFSWGLYRWLTPSNMGMIARKMDLYPFKELLLHVVNTSFFFNAVLNIIWPLMNDKLKNMFRFHYEDWPALHEFISPEILPAEYGGTGPDIDFEKLNQELFDQSSDIGARLKYQGAVQK